VLLEPRGGEGLTSPTEPGTVYKATIRDGASVLRDLQPTSARVSARFSRHPTRDTVPELALRRALHRLGLRYRVDFRPIDDLRRRADIVFTRARVAVFVDGCFWHGCPDHCRPSGRNVDWWRQKIETTRRRDANTDAALRAAGWHVIRIWSHTAVEDAVDLVVRALPERSP
jgi:DNA mismatch endonuclease, patch repair protein